MKTLSIFIFYFLFLQMLFSQSVTYDQAENSNDTRKLAIFLKDNPDHPKAADIRRKLFILVAEGETVTAPPSWETSKLKKRISGYYSSRNSTIVYDKSPRYKSSNTSIVKAKATNKTNIKNQSFTNTIDNKSNIGPSEESKKTANLLTHLFNNDPRKKEAYILIQNKTKCIIEVKIEGSTSYNVQIPAQKENYVMLNKGTYMLESNICGIPYASQKVVKKDMVVSLSIN